MGKPEAYVEDYLVTRCQKLGFLCYKFNPSGINGVPDRIVIGYGHTVFIETKRPGGNPRKLQEIRHREMRAHGARVFVADTHEGVDDLLHDLMSHPLSITQK